MTAARIALVLLVSSCSGGVGPSPTRPEPAGGSAMSGDERGCRSAYAEYERRWRIARSEELAGFGGTFEADVIEEIVSSETEELLDLEELRKLRLMYALIEAFIPEAAWVVAFTAAEDAIALCGENAQRPKPL